jgi:hypothetical protein
MANFSAYYKENSNFKYSYIFSFRWTIVSFLLSLPRSSLFSNYLIRIMLYHRGEVGRDSVVGIATHYGLDSPGIESRWGRDFPHPSRPALGSTHLLIQWVPCLFPADKAAGPWRWPPTPSRAEVKERVEVHLFSPSGLSWPVVRWILPLPLPSYHRGESLNNIVF